LKKRILITGGAGFIGSHLADRLLSRGHTVRLFDNLSEQVHGAGAVRPSYLDPELELIIGDIRDSDAVRRALSGIDVVMHLAAMVGVGQSMYEIEKYTSVNDIGTAVLLEALIERPVEKLIVASSMSIYGEGLYQTNEGEMTAAAERTLTYLKHGPG
jgi:dTDP-L-rhamnose 4-epimerase